VSRNKKPRKPYRPPAVVPAPLAAKRERDQAGAFVKVAGRMGQGRIINPVARKKAQHIGIQGGGE
jgi:hypothetical protein